MGNSHRNRPYKLREQLRKADQLLHLVALRVLVLKQFCRKVGRALIEGDAVRPTGGAPVDQPHLVLTVGHLEAQLLGQLADDNWLLKLVVASSIEKPILNGVYDI